MSEHTARSAPSPLPADFATQCATDLDLYLDPMLEDPPTRSSVSVSRWREYESLVSRARQACAACPLLDECLYKAIVQVDVSGYVGCTTPQERKAIRRLLDVSIDPDDLDTYAGTRAERQPIDHDTVLRARAAYPDDSLESLALRLECSLSTVKRHLRRARKAADAGEPDRSSRELPTLDEVFDAFDEVVDTR